MDEDEIEVQETPGQSKGSSSKTKEDELLTEEQQEKLKARAESWDIKFKQILNERKNAPNPK